MHPLLVARLRIEARKGLLEGGHDRNCINVACDAVDADFVSYVAASAGTATYDEALAVGGSGILSQILAAIEAFLSSAGGKALIGELIAALLAMLGL
jgi:hypothetical protein